MRASDPSDRNFEIFCEVEFAGMSLRAAAAKFELSVGRIQQIVAQVRSWHKAAAPDSSDNANTPGVAFHNYHLLEDRLRYLYQQAMDAWRTSQSEGAVRREQSSVTGGRTVTTTQSFGQVRYLAQAMRIAEAQYKAATRHALFCQNLNSKNAPASETVAPPTGVYAPEEEAAEEQEADTAEQVVATDANATSCDEHVELHVPVNSATIETANPMRSRLAKKLARHEKRKAARERMRGRKLV